MRLASFRGTPTIECKPDAPPGVLAIYRDAEGQAWHVRLVAVREGSGRAVVQRVADDEELVVRMAAVRLMLIGAWIPPEPAQPGRERRRRKGGRR